MLHIIHSFSSKIGFSRDSDLSRTISSGRSHNVYQKDEKKKFRHKSVSVIDTVVANGDAKYGPVCDGSYFLNVPASQVAYPVIS